MAGYVSGVHVPGTIYWVGSGPKSEEIVNFAIKASRTNATVLLTGESGVGKDHVARMIHDLGRPGYKFKHVNCGGLSDTLLESELFGHARGSFTGAHVDRRGLVRDAERGTLFFNEIANTSLEMQARLLDIAEKRSVRAVGSHDEYVVNTRIIAATNADLKEAVKKGKMRMDLYHRLNVISFRVPSLRERGEDIRELATSFLERDGATQRFTEEALRVLEEYHWPGNIRELENMIQRVMFHCDCESEIDAKDIRASLSIDRTEEALLKPSSRRLASGEADAQMPTYYEAKRDYLQCLIAHVGGNLRLAMETSGISRTKLYSMLRVHGLEDELMKIRGERKLTRRRS